MSGNTSRSGLLCPDAGLSQLCALIEAEKANYSISWMCRMLGVARSSFYAWRHRAEAPSRPADGNLPDTYAASSMSPAGLTGAAGSPPRVCFRS